MSLLQSGPAFPSVTPRYGSLIRRSEANLPPPWHHWLARAAAMISPAPYVKWPIINYESTLIRCFIFRDSWSLRRATSFFFFCLLMGLGTQRAHYSLHACYDVTTRLLYFNCIYNFTTLFRRHSFLFFFFLRRSDSAEFIKWRRRKEEKKKKRPKQIMRICDSFVALHFTNKQTNKKKRAWLHGLKNTRL